MPIRARSARRDEENASAIKRLIDAVSPTRVLMSQDVFLKMMLIRYGGFGYGYILKHFFARLKRHGMSRRRSPYPDRQSAARFLRQASRRLAGERRSIVS